MSALRDALAEYVATRRALGAQFREPAGTLSRFVDFLQREGAKVITTELALRWARKPQKAQPATWARRLTQVRGFARWLNASDPRTQVPPRGLLEARHRRQSPHIFTEQEVQLLMARAGRLHSSTGLRASSYVTLIGLLSATGLRPGEALRLDTVDVDLEAGVLAIRQTKFGKSRFVPIHESVRRALERYVKRRDGLIPHRRTEAFLVSERGTRLLGSATRRTFGSLSVGIGARKPTGRRIGRGPRLQDMRHTFATRRLIEWYRTGHDVQREMPKLSTYLGHGVTCHTYWYIEAVPELLQLATERLGSDRGNSR